jgi:hypothetical protein
LSDLPAAPYPADTRAKGWRFELDHERIRQSDTWALAPADLRPWLLMLWMTAWEQMPCGSLPAEDDLIAARIGMSAKLFAKHRRVLMRGWWQAEDGRLYHHIITQRVTEMLATKDRERTRKAAYRQRMDAERTRESHGSPQLSRGTDEGQTRDSHGSDPGRDGTRTGTGTGTGFIKNRNLSVPDGTDAGASGNSPAEKSAEQLTKDELWAAGKSLLMQAGMPKAQCGSYVGKLVKDYGDQIVIDAVRTAVVERPADAASFLKATCQTLAGQRTRPNKQERLEAKNRQIAERLAREGS